MSKLQEIKSAKELVLGVLGYQSPWTGKPIDVHSTYNDIYFCILHKYFKFGETFFHPHKVISFTSVDRAIREAYIPLGREVKIKEETRIREHYGQVPDKDFIGL
jgi:hypothetical protein